MTETTPLTETTPSAASSESHTAKRRFLKARADERGLTTLEWLLIVAAVAGLAALAVVLVSTVVGDTSEQIAGSSARLTAARLAGSEITLDAETDVPAGGLTAHADKAAKYEKLCNRLQITYSDIQKLVVKWEYTAALVDANADAAYWKAEFDVPKDEGCVVSVPSS